MRKRSDFIQRLHQSEKFKLALNQARTEEERQAVQAATEQFVTTFADILGPLIERVEQDPEFARQLGQALVEKQNVVTTSDPATSGSSG